MNPKPYIDFIITKNCNFRCPYCSQSKAEDTMLQDASDEVIEGFFAALNKLPKEFEITITGGEPLLHPRFFEIIEQVKNKGFRVSIVSNFTSSAQKYEKIIDTLDESLSFLMLSVHTHCIKNLDEFINKALIVKSHTHPETRMRVCAPLWDDNLAKLKYIEKKLNNSDIEFEVQHIRIKNKFYKYCADENNYLLSHGAAKNKNVLTFGKYCAAGALSAVVYEDGEIYRCYSSRLLKTHSLGNIKLGTFNLFDKQKPCPLFKCTCPKPMNYEMISNKKNFIGAFAALSYNILHLAPKIFKK